MNENVTVDEAISRGKRMVVYPTNTLIGVCIALAMIFTAGNVFPGKYLALGALTAVVGIWLLWRSQLTKWRLWAFDNVRNVNELKRRSIHIGLLPSNNFTENISWHSATEREQWERLQQKFLQPDEFHDDDTVPETTEVYYSERKIATRAILGMLVTGLGLLLLIKGYKDNVYGIMVMALGIYTLVSEYKRSRSSNPQIILSDKGIQLADQEITSWAYIGNDRVERGGGKDSNTYLNYDICIDGIEANKTTVSLCITEFNIDGEELFNLLGVYRGRYEQSTQPGRAKFSNQSFA